MVGHLANVITYAKFQDDIFRGYDFTGGRISNFSIDFCMGLTTVQRDCAACDNNNSDFYTAWSTIFILAAPYFQPYTYVCICAYIIYVYRVLVLTRVAVCYICLLKINH